MGKTIHEFDFEERPREKLLKYGADSLSDEELLAILIATGTQKKNAIELSREILNTFSDYELCSVTIEELSKIDGIKTAKAASIIAALNFSRRIDQKIVRKEIEYIKSPVDTFKLMRNYFLSTRKEHFYTILLNAKSAIISVEDISTGDLTSSIVNPREAFIPAVKKSARSLIMVHNHPSGDAKPSREDKLITNRLVEVGKILDIKVLDHVIMGKDSYYSFLEENNL